MSAPDSASSSAPANDEAPAPTGRIGRPPKLDEHGTPTRERLLTAAAEACVEFGYEGATLSDIARRANVSTPAVYSHFTGKAALLVEASQNELKKISTGKLVEAGGLREIARRWLQPDFANSRILVAEIHCASIRQPDLAEPLEQWQNETAERMHEAAGLTMSQVKLFYLLLIGLTHVNQVGPMPVTQEQIEAEVNSLLEGWFGDRYT